ncbi:MAG: hypothetical protein MUP44_10425 [Anaerolineales bacterium]|nr:hypothetical protein [Anaerolineales bacterium]
MSWHSTLDMRSGAYAVKPVVTAEKVAAGVAHGRQAQLAQRAQHVLAKTAFIGMG